MDQPNIRSLLGLCLSSPIILGYIETLTSRVSNPDAITPVVKSYPDAIYLNYFTLGLSLLFTPQIGYKPSPGLRLQEINPHKVVLESIDLYNAPQAKSSKASLGSAPPHRVKPAFLTFVALPLDLSLSGNVTDKDGKVITRPEKLAISADTTGKDFVSCLQEPDRKGGGVGPSTGSIGIWCEWSKDGIMIEFGGEEARGPQAWERGKDAVWKVITLFSPGQRGQPNSV